MVLGKTRINLEQSDSLSQFQVQSLHLLYAPLMSPTALRMYQLMIILSDLNVICDYSMLCHHLDLDISTVESTRKELERFWLLETYERNNEHFLRIKKPLDYYDFAKHPILGRMFISDIGIERLNEIIAWLSGSRFDELTNNISDQFSDAALSNFTSNHENAYRKVAKLELTQAFNMDVFLSQCGETVFPPHLRTAENLSLIETYALAYKITNANLKKYVGSSISVDQSFFKKDVFKKQASANHQPLPVGNPQDWPSEEFLKQLQNGIDPNYSDIQLIRKLREKYLFKDEIINLLLDYVVKNYKGSLNPNLVEKIATTWVRAKVSSPEDVVKQLEMQPKKSVKRVSTKVIKKAKDEKPPEVEMTQQEREAMIARINEGLKFDGK